MVMFLTAVISSTHLDMNPVTDSAVSLNTTQSCGVMFNITMSTNNCQKQQMGLYKGRYKENIIHDNATNYSFFHDGTL